MQYTVSIKILFHFICLNSQFLFQWILTYEFLELYSWNNSPLLSGIFESILSPLYMYESIPSSSTQLRVTGGFIKILLVLTPFCWYDDIFTQIFGGLIAMSNLKRTHLKRVISCQAKRIYDHRIHAKFFACHRLDTRWLVNNLKKKLSIWEFYSEFHL